MLAGAFDGDVSGRLAAPTWDLDHPGPGEELTGEGLRHLRHLLGRALGHDMATVLPRTGPHVDEMVGCPHRPFVVLDHQHRVAESAEPIERGDQLLVVALVKPDRRLVEDVQNAHER